MSRATRSRFDLPAGMVYMDGNSLGAAPAAAAARIDAVLATWRERAVRGWNDAGWLDVSLQLGDRIGALVGAAAGQVLAADSTSVNIFKALSAAVSMAGGPVSYLDGEFPTDRFIADRLGSRSAVGIEQMVGPGVALLSHVDYRTGELRDLARVTAAIHGAGGVVVWDLSHSAGAVPAALDAGAADFAVGCGYKFLNGGPGAPAWIYVAERHQEHVENPIPGWFGHRRPFDFGPAYEPAPGISRMLTGTPSIIALAGLAAGLDTFEGVSMDDLWAESIALGDRVMAALDWLGIEILTPRDPARRGSHVAARHPAARAVAAALLDAGVVVDVRPPDIVRFGITPLYLDADGVDRAMAELRAVIEGNRHLEARFSAPSRVP